MSVQAHRFCCQLSQLSCRKEKYSFHSQLRTRGLRVPLFLTSLHPGNTCAERAGCAAHLTCFMLNSTATESREAGCIKMECAEPPVQAPDASEPRVNVWQTNSRHSELLQHWGYSLNWVETECSARVNVPAEAWQAPAEKTYWATGPINLQCHSLCYSSINQSYSEINPAALRYLA